MPSCRSILSGEECTAKVRNVVEHFERIAKRKATARSKMSASMGEVPKLNFRESMDVQEEVQEEAHQEQQEEEVQQQQQQQEAPRKHHKQSHHKQPRSFYSELERTTLLSRLQSKLDKAVQCTQRSDKAIQCPLNVSKAVQCGDTTKPDTTKPSSLTKPSSSTKKSSSTKQS